ncbi:MAG: transcriptional regulator [Clostridia bacterium]|nr:transcriptional regulator [Clostridia bacterium]MBR4538514.1 transcriptional regulator [Clostridia bacterium]
MLGLLHKKRKRMGLNQIDFGNLIGKPGPYISNLESGQRGVSDAVWDKVSKLDETAIHREKNQKKTKPKGCGLIKENITALRTFLGLSQEEFAFSISRSSGFISSLDTGRSNASQETIDRICSVSPFIA